MIEPLQFSMDVGVPAERAFAIWTEKFASWWPLDHPVTAERGLTIVLEPRLGGRLYERTSDGAVHEWGEITDWDPPRGFSYLWHLRQDRSDATDVHLSFIPIGESSTRVEVLHSGWDRLGARAENLRDRNTGGWRTLMPHYLAALDETALDEGDGNG